jgi:glutamine amidotransferase
MSALVLIVDYGLGNLRSVAGAVERLGHTALVSPDPADIARADRLILPGVGAFGDGMRRLAARGFVEPLTEAVRQRQTPILGICLGAQLMARESHEFGHHQGLGWLPATVRPIEPAGRLRVPHVGWNELQQLRSDPLFAEIPPAALFYFVHSFHITADDPEIVAGTCEYGGTLAAVFRSGNICGTQFHPEKSQRHGLRLLQNFLAA